ncbi:hypothetical protein AAVH_38763, partial [Aphelenchoides avenae]
IEAVIAGEVDLAKDRPTRVPVDAAMSSVWPSSLLDNGAPPPTSSKTASTPLSASNGVDSMQIVSDAEKQAKQRRIIAGRVGASITFNSTIPLGYLPATASPTIT